MNHNLLFNIATISTCFGAGYYVGLALFFYNYSNLPLNQIITSLISSIQYTLILILGFGIYLAVLFRFKRLNECIKHYFVDNYFESFDKNIDIDNNVDLLIQLRKLYKQLYVIVDDINFCLSIEVSYNVHK